MALTPEPTPMTDHRLTGTGITGFMDGSTIEYRAQKLEREARRRNDPHHVWIFIVTHRLTEKTASEVAVGNLNLDLETIAIAGGPICYRCEQDGYTKEPCPGYREVIRAD